MSSSDDTKSIKNQSASKSHQFEKSLVALEDICFEIISGQFTHGKNDTDRLFWQQKLKNIATPLSLALSEYKGPRVFHQHYRHDAEDAKKLIPVMEPALDNVMAACSRALELCENMTGMKGSLLMEERTKLIKTLQAVIIHLPV